MPVPGQPGTTLKLRRFFAQSKGQVVQFAAGEIESDVWLFYLQVPDPDARKLLARMGAYGLVCVGAFLLFHGIQSQLLVAGLGAIVIGGGIWLERWAKAKEGTSAA